VDEGELSPEELFFALAFFAFTGRSKSPDLEVPCAPPAVEDGPLDCAAAREIEIRLAAPIIAILLNICFSLVVGLKFDGRQRCGAHSRSACQRPFSLSHTVSLSVLSRRIRILALIQLLQEPDAQGLASHGK
jgi:hypothetical protein